MLNAREQAILDKVHDYHYDMLCKFDDVCRKHNIKYYLYYGSLIGMARHKDFIPWDDDVDIVITRKNLKKLVKYQDELSPFFVHTPSADEGFFFDFTSRIINPMVKLKKDDDETEYYNGMNCQNLFIDLFTLDSFPGGIKGKILLFRLKILYIFAMSRRYSKDYEAPKSIIARAGISLLRAIGKIVPLSVIFKRYNKLAKSYNGKNCKFGFLSNAAIYFLDDITQKEWFRETDELPIRERMFPVPYAYDEIMRSIYGDYMQFPPEEDRKPVHIKNFDDIDFGIK